MLATVADTGLVMLGGWVTLLLGVSLLREAGPARARLRVAGALVAAAGIGLAVIARVAFT